MTLIHTFVSKVWLWLAPLLESRVIDGVTGRGLWPFCIRKNKARCVVCVVPRLRDVSVLALCEDSFPEDSMHLEISTLVQSECGFDLAVLDKVLSL